MPVKFSASHFPFCCGDGHVRTVEGKEGKTEKEEEEEEEKEDEQGCRLFSRGFDEKIGACSEKRTQREAIRFLSVALP